MPIPDIHRAQSILLGGKWTTILAAEESDDSWIRLQIPGGLAVNVRASAIEAVKYPNAVPQQRPEFAFDLGAV